MTTKSDYGMTEKRENFLEKWRDLYQDYISGEMLPWEVGAKYGMTSKKVQSIVATYTQWMLIKETIDERRQSI